MSRPCKQISLVFVVGGRPGKLALSMAGLIVTNMSSKLKLTSDWVFLSGAAQSLGISRWATGALLADAGVAGLAGDRV